MDTVGMQNAGCRVQVTLTLALSRSRERESALLLSPTLSSKRRGGSSMKRNGVMKDVSAYLRNLRNLRLRTKTGEYYD
jgi:hypothetical protein